MTTSNITKTCNRFNVPFNYETIEKVNKAGANIKVKRAVINADLMDTLISVVEKSDCISKDGKDISYRRGILLKNLRKERNSI